MKYWRKGKYIASYWGEGFIYTQVIKFCQFLVVYEWEEIIGVKSVKNVILNWSGLYNVKCGLSRSSQI